ncbi:MAG: hypothetical protein PHU25_03925, partial [Deltaproteobacteria bacterium]|nr:hypothetical protein [Deltaproteobacteria bacterium]
MAIALSLCAAGCGGAASDVSGQDAGPGTDSSSDTHEGSDTVSDNGSDSECPAGDEGCPCHANGTCNGEDLACEGDVCV